MSRETTCVSCDRPILDGIIQSLPIGRSTCDIVDNDYKGEWAGAAACKTCFDVHAAAGAKALDAHVKATASIRKELEEAYRVLILVRGQIEKGIECLGL